MRGVGATNYGAGTRMFFKGQQVYNNILPGPASCDDTVSSWDLHIQHWNLRERSTASHIGVCVHTDKACVRTWFDPTWWYSACSINNP
jgi:hypothetical protein